MIRPDRPQLTVRPCAVYVDQRKTVITHSEYAIFIYFPLQKWYLERDSYYVSRRLPVFCVLCVAYVETYVM